MHLHETHLNPKSYTLNWKLRTCANAWVSERIAMLLCTRTSHGRLNSDESMDVCFLRFARPRLYRIRATGADDTEIDNNYEGVSWA